MKTAPTLSAMWLLTRPSCSRFLTCAAYIRFLKKRVMKKTTGSSASAMSPSRAENSQIETTIPTILRLSTAMLTMPSENSTSMFPTSVMTREAVWPGVFFVK